MSCAWSQQEQGVTFAVLYWEEPDRSGHIFGPENTTAMGKALKEVRSFIATPFLTADHLCMP